MGKILRKRRLSTQNQLNKIVELFKEIKLPEETKLFLEINCHVDTKLSEEMKQFVELIDWILTPNCLFSTQSVLSINKFANQETIDCN